MRSDSWWHPPSSFSAIADQSDKTVIDTQNTKKMCTINRRRIPQYGLNHIGRHRIPILDLGRPVLFPQDCDLFTQSKAWFEEFGAETPPHRILFDGSSSFRWHGPWATQNDSLMLKRKMWTNWLWGKRKQPCKVALQSAGSACWEKNKKKQRTLVYVQGGPDEYRQLEVWWWVPGRSEGSTQSFGSIWSPRCMVGGMCPAPVRLTGHHLIALFCLPFGKRRITFFGGGTLWLNHQVWPSQS